MDVVCSVRVDPAQVTTEALSSPDIGLRRIADHRRVSTAGLDDRRGPHGEVARGHGLVVQHDRVGCDHRIGPDHGSMQHHGGIADERAVLDLASLEVHEVADHAVIADDRRIDGGCVQDTVVLDAGPLADDDLAVIAAQDRSGPDTAVSPDRDRADDHRIGVYISVGMDRRDSFAERVEGHRCTLATRALRACWPVFETGLVGSPEPAAGSAMEFWVSNPIPLPAMSRRIDIELTSERDDGTWTWRAAGARQPKGVVDASLLPDGSKVGDQLKVEVVQEIDGISVESVVQGREKVDRRELLALITTEDKFEPVTQQRAGKRRDGRDGRPGRDGGRGGDGRSGDRDRSRRRRDGDERRGRDGDRRDKRPANHRFTPPPAVPSRPKPKRLKPRHDHRNEVLGSIPEEQRPIAEVAVQGMPAVRQRVAEENERLAAENKPTMPVEGVLKMAEELLPRLRVAEWLDRAEAAQRIVDEVDLRDLRSVVAAASDPVVARDERARSIETELRSALARRQEQELELWYADIDASLAVGRVIRALRLSSQPPKAGVRFPPENAKRLALSANAALAPTDGVERWVGVLEAAAFSPIRGLIEVKAAPSSVDDELRTTVTRLAPLLPQVAAAFGIDVPADAPVPKPLRPVYKSKAAAKSKASPKSKTSARHSETSPVADAEVSDDSTPSTPDVSAQIESVTSQDSDADTAPSAEPVPEDGRSSVEDATDDQTLSSATTEVSDVSSAGSESGSDTPSGDIEGAERSGAVSDDDGPDIDGVGPLETV